MICGDRLWMRIVLSPCLLAMLYDVGDMSTAKTVVLWFSPLSLLASMAMRTRCMAGLGGLASGWRSVGSMKILSAGLVAKIGSLAESRTGVLREGAWAGVMDEGSVSSKKVPCWRGGFVSLGDQTSSASSYIEESGRCGKACRRKAG